MVTNNIDESTIFSSDNILEKLDSYGEVDINEEYPVIPTGYYHFQVVGEPQLGERSGTGDNAGYSFLKASWRLKVTDGDYKGLSFFFNTDLGKNKKGRFVHFRFWNSVKALLGETAYKQIMASKSYKDQVVTACKALNNATGVALVHKKLSTRPGSRSKYFNTVDAVYHPSTEASDLPPLESDEEVSA